MAMLLKLTPYIFTVSLILQYHKCGHRQSENIHPNEVEKTRLGLALPFDSNMRLALMLRMNNVRQGRSR